MKKTSALLIGLLILAAPGFAQYANDEFNPNANNAVRALAVQSDGKILVGGDFTTLHSELRNRIGRICADGRLDYDFDYLAGSANTSVYCLAVQTDGKILVGGVFSAIGGGDQPCIARLNLDGTFDVTFRSSAGANARVRAVAVQSDGKVLAGGDFTKLGGRNRDYIGRFYPDGITDQGFHGYAGDRVYSMMPQTNWTVVIGGAFETLGGDHTCYHISKVANDNTSYGNFCYEGANDSVLALILQPDGTTVAGGEFTQLGGDERGHLGMVNADGSLNRSFQPRIDGNNICAMALQADGKIIVGGSFSTIGDNIGRLSADGYLDTFFGAQASADGFVCSLTLQPDGKILVGGNFTNLAGVARDHFGRLSNNDAALQNLSVNDAGSAITWARGGASPEVWRVTFEQSTNATTWTSLGAGTWSTNGWQLAGLSLPTNQNVYIRARGYGVGGMYAGSSFFHESVRLAWITRLAVDILLPWLSL